MEFVNASIDDCEELIELHQILNQENPFVPYLKESSKAALKRMRSFFEVPDNPYLGAFLAKQNGKIVGNLWVGRSFEPQWSHVASFGVAILAAHHRKGVGRHLLQQAEDWAQNQGCLRMSLKVVSQNLNAVEFHLKRGYQMTGLDRQSYRVGADFFDEYILSKALPTIKGQA